MRWSNSYIPTIRELPAEASAASHRLMLRAGLIRQLANGSFAYLPLGLRALRKVERIMRDELDSAGILEVGVPVGVDPAAAEEAIAALVRPDLSSWRQLPIAWYRIDTQYRDAIQPRHGVMRARASTSMDAYSFHADAAGLDTGYETFAGVARRVFIRCGLRAVPVQGVAGEGFAVESPVGDDTLLLCDCGYAAHVAAAVAATAEAAQPERSSPAVKIATPGVKTIAALADFTGSEPAACIKTLIYRAAHVAQDLAAAPGCRDLARDENGTYPCVFVAVCVRGDRDVGAAKLAAILAASEVELASWEEAEAACGVPFGFIGPVGLTGIPLLCDSDVMTMHDACVGGLETDTHIVHVEPGRDFTPWLSVDLRIARQGDRCVECGKPLCETQANELARVAKLGTGPSGAIGVSYLNTEGVACVPTVDRLTIEIDRTLASIIEAHHDDNGIIWPMSIAPYQVAIVPIRYQGRVAEVADDLYTTLHSSGVDVILDDRGERPGVKFKDVDLIGVPIRVVVGERDLPNVHIRSRGHASDDAVVAADRAADAIVGMIDSELSSLKAYR